MIWFKVAAACVASFDSSWRTARRALPLLPCPVLLLASAADPLFNSTYVLTGTIRFAPLPRFKSLDFAPIRHQVMTGLIKATQVPS